ncbi:citrate lyase holo-[acyl-carrier protein] synthase [Desulfosporosinus sp. Sb-LF]|uniref:citrate lyase holo-[acyl-carrier protein] synthase n=1 Tax=Desulfosporosinus sp. Sb-LF TaxID=2560027 RepID=UPI00107EEE0C|nr:citrate lyase holo-[acyl-carrier protein] synthase [Desulfosporosinus sp. Sb-LF]TGE33683.1 citrate lyase holo-[acyl-carrier protein] synthase [Desulfosporosinus sp. Sb-LF]
MVTKEQILLSREKRALCQQEWLEKYHAPLVSFTLNIPGQVKQTTLYNRVHEEGLAALLEAITVIDYEKRALPTGSEAIIAVRMDAFMLKKYTVALEEHHPLGRLFDMDVLDADGYIVSRKQLQLPSRRCLLCNEDARICGRSQAHSIKALVSQIEDKANEYFNAQIRTVL